MKTVTYIFSILLFLAMPRVCLSGPTPTRVAVIMRLNDNYVKFPQSILKGLQFALNESKVAKSILMKTFSHTDQLTSLEEAIIQAKKFSPDIVIGGETSQLAILLTEEFKDKVFITPTASSVLLSQINPDTIRLSHADDQYLKILEVLVERKKFKKVGIIHNISYPNSNLLSLKAAEYLKSKNISTVIVKIVKDESLNKAKLLPLIDGNVDSLVLFSYDDDMRKVFSTLGENNLFPFYIGGDGWGRDEFLKKNLLSTTKGKMFRGARTLYWNPERKDDWFRLKRKEIEKKLGEEIDDFHAIGYDVGRIVCETVQKSFTRNSFVSLLKNKTFTHLLTSKKIKFTEKLYPIKDFHIFFIQENEIHLDSSVGGI